MGIRDKLKRQKHDEQSIGRMLEDAGATEAQARDIVQTLSSRLTPDQMDVWLSHPERSHPVPDPGSSKRFEDAGLVPVVMSWTPINAVSAGKTELVVAEAKRFAESGQPRRRRGCSTIYPLTAASRNSGVPSASG